MADLVVSWNGKSYRGPAYGSGVAQIIDQWRPEVIALHEQRGNRTPIRRARSPLYRRNITGRHGDWSSSGLLVRRDVELGRFGVLRVRHPWVGPNGRSHDGRGFPFARVNFPDAGWVWVVGVHMPWNRSRNPGAWSTCWDALERFADSRTLPLMFVGDWNINWLAAEGRHIPQSFADRIGGRVVPGHGIDFAIVRGIRARGWSGPHYGSDHPSTRYALEEGRPQHH